MALVGYDEKVIEIKPKTVYEKDSASFCLVLYSIIDQKDKIDKELQEVKVGNGQHFRYISFKHSSSEIKTGSLHISDANNVEVGYKYINITTIDDKVEYQGNTETI